MPDEVFEPTNALWQLRDRLVGQLAALMNRPPTAYDTVRGKAWVVLDAIAIEWVSTDSQFVLHRKRDDGRWMLAEVIAWSPVTPFSAKWWKAVSMRFQREIFQALPDESRKWAANAWIAEQLLQYCQGRAEPGHTDTRGQRMNRQWRSALSLPWRWLAKAGGYHLESRNAPLDISNITRLMKVWTALNAQHMADQPRAITIAGLALTQTIPPTGNLFHESQRAFDSAGGTTAQWRLLHRYAEQLHLRCIDWAAGNYARALALATHCIELSGVVPHRWFIQLLHNHFKGHDLSLAPEVLEDWDDELYLSPHALRCAAQAAHAMPALPDSEEQDAFQRDLMLISQFECTRRPTYDRAQRQAGWQWLRRRAERWLVEQHHHEITIDPLCRPILEYAEDGYIATLLRTRASFVAESFYMRHCVEDYWQDAANGKVACFSVRNAHTGQRLTIGLIYLPDQQAWTLWDNKGFANREPDGEQDRFAHKLARACSRAEQQIQFRLNWGESMTFEDFGRRPKGQAQIQLGLFPTRQTVGA